MENSYKIIECDGLQFAVFIETLNKQEHSTYYPFNILFYIKQGQLKLQTEHGNQTFPSNSFCLIRKYTTGKISKAWTKAEGYALTSAFILEDQLIQTIIEELNVPIPPQEITAQFFEIASNPSLVNLFDAVIPKIMDDKKIDQGKLISQTKTAIKMVMKSKPEYLALFAQLFKSGKAELHDFMEFHYQKNISLKHLAKLSGRSLSTFNREFKAIFKETPHRWILNRRLNKARELLLTTERLPSEIYLELGFEEIAHFSRSFKKAFGQTPTEARKFKG